MAPDKEAVGLSRVHMYKFVFTNISSFIKPTLQKYTLLCLIDNSLIMVQNYELYRRDATLPGTFTYYVDMPATHTAKWYDR